MWMCVCGCACVDVCECVKYTSKSMHLLYVLKVCQLTFRKSESGKKRFLWDSFGDGFRLSTSCIYVRVIGHKREAVIRHIPC